MRRFLSDTKGKLIIPLALLLRRFRRDQSGAFVIITALVMPVLIGTVGLGTEVALWLNKHRTLQSAADSSAVSAATAYFLNNTADVPVQAKAVSASYGFTNGLYGVTVAVNRPPQSGSYTTQLGAVEVIVQQPQIRLFSALWTSDALPISARAVAVSTNSGLGCVLSLHPTAAAATKTQGGAQVVLSGCSLYDNSADANGALTVGGSGHITALSVEVVGGISGPSNLTTTQGVHTGQPPASDPYASTSIPSFSGCTQNNFHTTGTVTINPGVYCNGFRLNGGANVTMNPGIYYMDRGSFAINGGTTLTGNGVTIIFTSSTGNNYATASINGGATVNLTAPTTGPTAGIALFGDRNMPNDRAFSFSGGSTQVIDGAIYVPKGDVSFAGGSSTSTGCTQLIARTITFSDNSKFALNCSGKGTKPLGSVTAKLVE